MAYSDSNKQRTPSEVYELLQLIVQKQEQLQAQLQEQAQIQAQLQKQLQDQDQRQLQDQDQRQKQLQDQDQDQDQRQLQGQDQDQGQLQGQFDSETETISFGDIGNNRVTVHVDNTSIAVLVLALLGLSNGSVEDSELKGYINALITKSSLSE